jgi:hypothetical protein
MMRRTSGRRNTTSQTNGIQEKSLDRRNICYRLDSLAAIVLTQKHRMILAPCFYNLASKQQREGLNAP